MSTSPSRPLRSRPVGPVELTVSRDGNTGQLKVTFSGGFHEYGEEGYIAIRVNFVSQGDWQAGRTLDEMDADTLEYWAKQIREQKKWAEANT